MFLTKNRSSFCSEKKSSSDGSSSLTESAEKCIVDVVGVMLAERDDTECLARCLASVLEDEFDDPLYLVRNSSASP